MLPSVGGPRHRAVLRGVAVIAVACLLIPIYLGLLHKKPHMDRRIPLRILPLGDSITWGWHPESQQNGTNGYRAQLLRSLVLKWYPVVDFVGTQHSGLMFDNDNEGHVGAVIRDIRGKMKAGLEMRPNIVLVHAGTSDLEHADSATASEVPAQLEGLIDDVLETCPDAVVLVAKIIQAAKPGMHDKIKAFNRAIPAIVRKKMDNGFKVRAVDLSVVGTSDLSDGLHPSYAGYARMGSIWAEAVHAAGYAGLVTAPVDPKISNV
ncbi:hypothetical protein ACJQWK_11155 [Exserohilum turcicum]